MNLLSKKYSVLPGFGLSLGFTIFYLSFLVLIPISTLFFKTATLTWSEFFGTISSARVLAAYRLSLVASLLAAGINVVFGFLTAWVLVRYSFPGKKIIEGLVDLPFVLPTAVAGIALTTIYAPNGWLGQVFYKIGIPTAYSQVGILIALTFVGLPFVVRTLQPVLEELPVDTSEAAASLGAKDWKIFWQVIFPELKAALATGFSLAFARAIGEYGSVVFISGNMPMKTEVTPLLIMTKLEQFDYAGATAVSVVMLLVSFSIMLFINILNGWSRKRFAMH